MTRPSGPRPTSEKDLVTPKIGHLFRQQQFAPILQQRMEVQEGGAGLSRLSRGSQQEPVDLARSSELSSKEATSSSAQTKVPPGVATRTASSRSCY